MRRALALLLFASSAAHAAAVPKNWPDVITANDDHRIHSWRGAFMRALGQARASGHGAEIDAEGALLQPDAALADPVLPAGRYKCRVIKLGMPSGGTLAYVDYPGFNCAVTGDRLVKLNGSQRQAGTIYPDTAVRMIFLGTLALGDEKTNRPYGVDRERDIVGTIQRVGDQRWRLVMPFPRYESLIDVLELTPAA